MATDYDAPRKTDEESREDSIEELKNRRNDKNSGKVDEDEAEAAESFELPGADLSHEELTVRVLPREVPTPAKVAVPFIAGVAVGAAACALLRR